MAKSSAVYAASAVAAALTIVGLMLNAVSVATDNWISLGPLGHYGLWRSCTHDMGGTSCTFIAGLPIWLIAVRALTVLAGMVSLITVTCVVVAAAAMSPTSATAAVVSSVLAFASLAIGMLVWVYEIQSGENNSDVVFAYDWSFVIGWAGVGCYVLGAVTTGIQSYIVWRPDREDGSYKILPDTQIV